MKSILIILILISSVCLGQYKPTKLDTLKAIVANDSLTVINTMEDFKSTMFKQLDNSGQYDFIKNLIDKFMVEKKRRWEQYIKQNK